MTGKFFSSQACTSIIERGKAFWSWLNFRQRILLLRFNPLELMSCFFSFFATLIFISWYKLTWIKIRSLTFLIQFIVWFALYVEWFHNTIGSRQELRTKWQRIKHHARLFINAIRITRGYIDEKYNNQEINSKLE